MLVLGRRIHQRIIINGDIEVEVCYIEGRTVGIGITAPERVNIVRAELVETPEVSRD